MPIAHQYDPELVFVACGFDAVEGDLLGGCQLSPTCYGHMTRMLNSLAQGRTAIFLEGGYNLLQSAKSMQSVAHSLLGDPLPPLHLLKPSPLAIDAIRRTILQQKKKWILFPIEEQTESVLKDSEFFLPQIRVKMIKSPLLD
jgi:histone deacetylase 6